jgi:GAF domain-containing protein
VIATGTAEAVADCRSDDRFAARIAQGTGYVPYTMLVVPLLRGERAIGVLSLLDRRSGDPYTSGDTERAALFAELAVKALDVTPEAFTSLGMTMIPGSRGAP